jgi:hypothetical protein
VGVLWIARRLPDRLGMARVATIAIAAPCQVRPIGDLTGPHLGWRRPPARLGIGQDGPESRVDAGQHREHPWIAGRVAVVEVAIAPLVDLGAGVNQQRSQHPLAPFGRVGPGLSSSESARTPDLAVGVTLISRVTPLRYLLSGVPDGENRFVPARTGVEVAMAFAGSVDRLMGHVCPLLDPPAEGRKVRGGQRWCRGS